jgi:entericidin B
LVIVPIWPGGKVLSDPDWNIRKKAPEGIPAAFFGYNKQIKKGKRRNFMIRQVAVAVLLTLCVTILAGCNTVKGVGKDIESGGKAIERSSGK